MNDKNPDAPDYPRLPPDLNPFKASLMIYVHLMARLGVQRIQVFDTRE